MTEAHGRAPSPPDTTGPARDRVLTVPNVLSVLRLALVPVFLWLLLVAGATGWAVAVLMFSGFSDWADGKIARLVDNQSSRLGELLDPAVARIYMLVVPVAMALTETVAAPVAGSVALSAGRSAVSAVRSVASAETDMMVCLASGRIMRSTFFNLSNQRQRA